MYALKKQVDRPPKKSALLPLSEEVPVFIHFGIEAMKIQVCQIAPGETPNFLQLVFTKGAFAWTRLFPGKRLEFRFQKSTMLPYTKSLYFGHGQFVVEQSMILPLSLAQRLDIASHWIRQGIYPVTETKEELIVTF